MLINGAKDTQIYPNYGLRIRGRWTEIAQPVVMGILNITQDSFFDGGRYIDAKNALERCARMLEEGADWIDIGAQSTRPGAKYMGSDEEWKRLEPILGEIKARYPEVIVSVDTFHSEVARRSVEAGADIINDVSGGTYDPGMFAAIGALKVPYVLMHTQGKPDTMQENPQYKNVVGQVTKFLAEKVQGLTSMGATDLIIDPGFGFGKTRAHNFEMMRELGHFHLLGHPLMVGISRKTMIWETLNTSPEGALNGSTALHMYALERGAHILRVHDVREAVETRTLWINLQNLK